MDLQNADSFKVWFGLFLFNVTICYARDIRYRLGYDKDKRLLQLWQPRSWIGKT